MTPRDQHDDPETTVSPQALVRALRAQEGGAARGPPSAVRGSRGRHGPGVDRPAGGRTGGGTVNLTGLRAQPSANVA